MPSVGQEKRSERGLSVIPLAFDDGNEKAFPSFQRRAEKRMNGVPIMVGVKRGMLRLDESGILPYCG